MFEQTKIEKGYIFQIWALSNALSSFRVRTTQILKKIVSVSVRNGKKHSWFRIVKIRKAVKRGIFSDNTAKRVVFTETWNTFPSHFIDPLFKHRYPTEGQAPPWGDLYYICVMIKDFLQ